MQIQLASNPLNPSDLDRDPNFIHAQALILSYIKPILAIFATYVT